MCDMTEVLTSAKVVVTWQYINISNQQVVHLKLTQCYMSIISQFLRKEE